MAADVIVNIRAEDNFTGVLGNFGSIMTGVESVINLAADAFRTFGDFAMQGLEATASYERMSATMETLAARELLASGAVANWVEAVSYWDKRCWADLISPNMFWIVSSEALAPRQNFSIVSM